jgi:hypothetical protein
MAAAYGGGVNNENNRKRHGNNGGMKSVINGVMASAVMARRNGVNQNQSA